MSESLIELFRHNSWANRRLFDACAELSDAQLDATAVGTFGSIRGTLTHIVGAQERFAAALAETEMVGSGREHGPFPGLAALRGRRDALRRVGTSSNPARSGCTRFSAASTVMPAASADATPTRQAVPRAGYWEPSRKRPSLSGLHPSEESP